MYLFIYFKFTNLLGWCGFGCPNKLRNTYMFLILIDKYNPKVILLGYDNAFGYKKSGTFNYLSENNKFNSIKVEECDQLTIDGEPIKSSIIKNLIMDGEIQKANTFLGYKYLILGNVIKGMGLGSKIGFPTANIEISDNKQLIPANGVYSVNLINGSKIYIPVNKGHKVIFYALQQISTCAVTG